MKEICFIDIAVMGSNTAHIWRKGMAELKESLRLADAFTSIEQKKGDRYIKVFVGTFVASIAMVFDASFRTSTAIPFKTASISSISPTAKKSLISCDCGMIESNHEEGSRVKATA